MLLDPNVEYHQPWEPMPGTSQELALGAPCNHIFFHGTRGPGKDVEINTPVLTDSGWKRAGDVTHADRLVALDGRYTEVVGIFPKSNRPMWRVEFEDGEVVTADSEHRWLTLNQKTGYREGWKVRTTEQLAAMRVRCSVPFMQGAIPGKQWEGIDPYWIGYIIANGTTKSARLCAYTIDDEVLDYAENLGWYRWRGEQTAARAICPEALASAWRAVIPDAKGDEKFVPADLLWADPATRLAVLQGLMDGDGNCEAGAKSRYTTVSRQLAEDICHLVKSLGGWAKYHWREHNTGYGDRGWRYIVNISHHNMFNPFRIARKASKYVEQKKHLTRGIKSITFSHYGDGVCFAVAHDSHCFVVGDWVITHNTDTQLMHFRSRVGAGYGSHWTGILFDRKYKNLDDIVRKAKRWFNQYDDGAQWYSSKADYKWVWPTGEELLIRAFENVDDYWNYHGQEFPWIGWNELCKYPNGDAYESMMSCNRSSWTQEKDSARDDQGNFLTAPIPLQVFSTANPWGPGHAWVKDRFIDAAPVGEIVEINSKVYHPALKTEVDVTKTQVAIFGSYRENIYLSPEYIAELDAITDENKRKAWLEGDWDVTAGGAVDDLYRKHIHVKPRFVVPASWRIDRSMDWGSSHPCSVGWWAEANGEAAVMPDGSTFCPPRGTLIQIGELYFAENLTKNVGTRDGPTAIAEKIIKYEIAMMEQGWISSQPWPGPADNQIRNVTDSESDTIEQKFRKAGIRWTESDKAPGSRKNGLELIRERLRATKDNSEDPGLFFMENCLASIATIPPLPRNDDDPDDVDTDAIDHPYDMVRYRVLKAANRSATVIKLKHVR